MGSNAVNYENLLDADGSFRVPITTTAQYEAYLEAYLARHDQKGVAPPLDLPPSDHARQIERAALRSAMTVFDPSLEYPQTQAVAMLKPSTGRRKKPRWQPHEFELKAFQLQAAIENASCGKCRVPMMNESKKPSYESFTGHQARFRCVRDLLVRNKGAVRNIMSTDSWLIRLAWRPVAEKKKLEQNEASAKTKKDKFDTTTKVAPSEPLEEDEDENLIGDDHAVVQNTRKRKRPRLEAQGSQTGS
ncbi:hypothetical protein GGR57DRAFT_503978 [Xylariaceae sp. FL1272]|nr:hypothetical protein GGR57DRAFT_503978 [Xylariaceae sp. FL1272]